MKTVLRAIPYFLGGLTLASVIGIVLAWSTIEREGAPWAIARALHATDVTVETAADENGALVLGNLAFRNSDGTVELHAARARIAGGAFGFLRAAFDASRPIDVALSSPHLDISLAAMEPNYAKATLDSLRGDAIGSRRLTIALDDGSATIGDPSEEGRSLSISGIHGHIDVTNDRAIYDLGANELARGVAYPFVASSTASDAGDDVTHTIQAPALALQPLFGVIPGPGLVVRGGFVRALSVSIETSPAARPVIHGSGTFVHVTGSLEGDASRGFAEADGRLRIDGTTLIVPTVTAQLGKASLDAFGEFHDLPLSARWLQAGTRELALAGRTLDAIAGQPDLDQVSLDVDAPGIIYAHYHMNNPLGPRQISVVAIDPKVPGVRLDTAIAEDTIISGGERTSALANRTAAVAGINGDYFDIGRTYQPQGMLMSGGHLLRSPTDRATLAIHKDGSVTFGEYRCSGTLTSNATSLHISEFNDWPAGLATVVTPAFGKTLRAASGETFVGLEPVDEAQHTYRVSEVTPSESEMPARFGVGFGEDTKGALPRQGQLVKMNYGCSPSLDDVVAILGGGPQLLKDGEWYEDPHPPAPDERPVRWPVVALVRMKDGTLAMVAVDGRHPERALGMDRPEFADLLKSLGGDEAMALDSGGSVTLVSRRPGDKINSVRNRPSDEDGERWISDGLFVYSDRPAPSTTEGPAIVPAAAPSGAPDVTSTTLETIVNPDLPGNGVVTSPAPVASGSPGPSGAPSGVPSAAPSVAPT